MDLRQCSFICHDLHISISPPIVFCVNCSMIFLVSNLVTKIRSRHNDTDYHFVREMINRGALNVEFVHSLHQLDYLFTKALGADRFQEELSKKNEIVSY